MCCQIKIRQGIFLCQILVYDNRKRLWGIYMESWTDINRQEFLSDIKNEYLNLRNKKLEEYEDLKDLFNKKREDVAQKEVLWELSKKFESDSKIEEAYAQLNDALKSFRELEQNPELLAKKRSLESQISWLNDIVSRC